MSEPEPKSEPKSEIEYAKCYCKKCGQLTHGITYSFLNFELCAKCYEQDKETLDPEAK